MTEDTPQPWEQQPGESPPAFAAFVRFRDLPANGRSLDAAYDLHRGRQRSSKRASGRWNVWYQRWRWRERAQEWDRELDRQKREAETEAIVEAARRHANISLAFQQCVVERLQQIDPETLSPLALIRWFDVSVRIERISRGMAMDAPSSLMISVDTGADAFRAELEAARGDPAFRDKANELARLFTEKRAMRIVK